LTDGESWLATKASILPRTPPESRGHVPSGRQQRSLWFSHFGQARDAVDRARPGATARQITLDFLPSTDLRALADRDRVAQILDNYLSNALRYARDGSRVIVSAERRDGSIVASVQDSGPGLTAEQKSQVFERFYRVDPSRSRALGGAGIGLAIALAEAMDGRAWAESDGPGAGSTFFVSLPQEQPRPGVG
jgi:signal transduction histidine kinase